MALPAENPLVIITNGGSTGRVVRMEIPTGSEEHIVQFFLKNGFAVAQKVFDGPPKVRTPQDALEEGLGKALRGMAP